MRKAILLTQVLLLTACDFLSKKDGGSPSPGHGSTPGSVSSRKKTGTTWVRPRLFVRTGNALPTSGLSNEGPAWRSFTPTSHRVPIFEIRLQRHVSDADRRDEVIYKCEGSAEDCSVEVGAQGEVTLPGEGELPISAGRMFFVKVYTCGNLPATPHTLTGEVNLGGQTLSTQPGGLRVGGDPNPMTVQSHQCQWDFRLGESVVLEPNVTHELSLYFNPQGFAWAGTGEEAQVGLEGTNHCLGGETYLCVSPFHTVATFSKDEPEFQSFALRRTVYGEHPTSAWMWVVHHGGVPVGSVLRHLYVHGEAPQFRVTPHRQHSFFTQLLNSGKWKLRFSDPAGGNITRFEMEGFELGSHRGRYSTSFGGRYPRGGTGLYYQAVEI